LSWANYYHNRAKQLLALANPKEIVEFGKL